MTKQQITWYRHHLGGAVHGFTHPLPEEIAAQVRTGKLTPCAAPGDVHTLDLSPERIAQLEAADTGPRTVEDKRAWLLAQLAQLDDQIVPSPGADVAGAAPGDGAKTPRARTGAAK